MYKTVKSDFMIKIVYINIAYTCKWCNYIWKSTNKYQRAYNICKTNNELC